MNTAELLLGAIPAVRAANAEREIPDVPGLYAIFIDSAGLLPSPFGPRLESLAAHLIYVGIATTSLQQRLVDQDLRHRGASTFFRGLGAVLGYRPPAGSLVGKANQKNFRFSRSDTSAIVNWINRNLEVRFLPLERTALAAEEKRIIFSLCPLLNTIHNPQASPELAVLRDECRIVARTPHA